MGKPVVCVFPLHLYSVFRRSAHERLFGTKAGLHNEQESNNLDNQNFNSNKLGSLERSQNSKSVNNVFKLLMVSLILITFS